MQYPQGGVGNTNFTFTSGEGTSDGRNSVPKFNEWYTNPTEPFDHVFMSDGANGLRVVNDAIDGYQKAKSGQALESKDYANIVDAVLGLFKDDKQLANNKALSLKSEAIVKAKLLKSLKSNEILIESSRIYITGGKTPKAYAVPDFAIYNTETGKITAIIDAKNGNADLTDAQKELNKKGGYFKGSSRFEEAKASKVDKGMVEVERTYISN